jgi:hypothetical protein
MNLQQAPLVFLTHRMPKEALARIEAECRVRRPKGTGLPSKPRPARGFRRRRRVVGERDAAVVERTLANDRCSGWGIRTLSCSNPRHNPLGYHLGTVCKCEGSVSDAATSTSCSADEASARRWKCWRLEAEFAFPGRTAGRCRAARIRAL